MAVTSTTTEELIAWLKTMMEKEPLRRILPRCCCDVCGGQLDKSKDYSRRHRSCQLTRDKEIYDKRIATAEKLESWGGPVFNDKDGRGDENDYYQNVDALIDSLEDDGITLPEYVFVCKVEPCVLVDVNGILDDIELPDELDFMAISGVAEFEKAINAFNEANSGIVSWKVDYKRAVRVAAAEAT